MPDESLIEGYSPKKIWNLFLLLAGSSMGCLVFLLLRIIFTGRGIFLFLVWNLFLAWIPLGVSFIILWFNTAKQTGRSRKTFTLLLGFAWLIFYPNAPYILTDIVHLFRLGMYYRDMNELVTANALIWYDIILNAAFAFTGHLLGLFSLLFMHQVVEKLFNKIAGWGLVLATCLLSGFGIYLGRFERLNSTDIIVYPFVSLKEIFENLFYLKAVLFSSGVGFFILITYLSIYAFHRLHEK